MEAPPTPSITPLAQAGGQSREGEKHPHPTLQPQVPALGPVAAAGGDGDAEDAAAAAGTPPAAAAEPAPGH